MRERRGYHDETEKSLAYRRIDFLLRSMTTSALALIIVLVACWETVKTGDVKGWAGVAAGVVVGFYFGQHAATNGHNLPRRARSTDMQPGDES